MKGRHISKRASARLSRRASEHRLVVVEWTPLHQAVYDSVQAIEGFGHALVVSVASAFSSMNSQLAHRQFYVETHCRELVGPQIADRLMTQARWFAEQDDAPVDISYLVYLGGFADAIRYGAFTPGEILAFTSLARWKEVLTSANMIGWSRIGQLRGQHLPVWK
jgi:hypothetical protein